MYHTHFALINWYNYCSPLLTEAFVGVLWASEHPILFLIPKLLQHFLLEKECLTRKSPVQTWDCSSVYHTHTLLLNKTWKTLIRVQYITIFYSRSTIQYYDTVGLRLMRICQHWMSFQNRSRKGRQYPKISDGDAEILYLRRTRHVQCCPWSIWDRTCDLFDSIRMNRKTSTSISKEAPKFTTRKHVDLNDWFQIVLRRRAYGYLLLLFEFIVPSLLKI